MLLTVATRFDLWHASSLKTTIYWFLGTAMVLVADSVIHGAQDRQRFVTRVFRRVVTVTVIVEFVVTVYVFPLALEFVGILVVLTATLVHVNSTNALIWS